METKPADTWEAFKADVKLRLDRGDGPRSFVIERAFDVMNAKLQKAKLEARDGG